MKLSWRVIHTEIAATQIRDDDSITTHDERQVR
jgi:hypothetical protein